ncbi:protein ei24 homolog [Phtheirospermum japonicum]|uniref:Protein ei24 homolog n=1 Tax=Phtheirospermum japonicum TaxID=374723 RepID=A0A830D5E3_9LAMI|nr:protein ei24 homolog [Phtheirospermum japonicum]
MDTTIIRGFLGSFKPKLKQASLLWLEGFREACCLHRVIIYCLRSRELARRTRQVFLLNGFIFLGRYNDIAKYGFFAIEKQESSGQKDTTASDNKSTDLEGVMIGIAEQVYSVLLLSFFFLEVYVTGFIPYIGKAVNFLLLSWMKPVCSGSILLLSPCELWGYGCTLSITTGSEADKVIASQRKKWKGAGLGRIPIFFSADYLS